jgi:hypothetical protein
MGDIINLDEYRQDKEEEEADAIESERRYLGLTLKSVLNQMASVEDRADRLKNRDQIRETRREIETDNPDSLSDSWFTRIFRRNKDDADD